MVWPTLPALVMMSDLPDICLLDIHGPNWRVRATFCHPDLRLWRCWYMRFKLKNVATSRIDSIDNCAQVGPLDVLLFFCAAIEKVILHKCKTSS